MADSSFGLKIGLEGEREFKRAITDINREMRVLGSEMKLVASSFDKNDKSAEALTARNQVLGKEIEAQKSKIETLRAALENSASSFGENDSRTKNWQIQLNNAGAELNRLEGELKANNDALSDFGNEVDGAGDDAKGAAKDAGRLEGAVDDLGDEMDTTKPTSPPKPSSPGSRVSGMRSPRSVAAWPEPSKRAWSTTPAWSNTRPPSPRCSAIKPKPKNSSTI